MKKQNPTLIRRTFLGIKVKDGVSVENKQGKDGLALIQDIKLKYELEVKMKHKFMLGFLLCALGLCLYLFQIIYAETKENAIAELNSRQMIHAKQARRGIEDFFSNVTIFLTKISESSHIVDLDDQGRNELDFALAINPEAITAITRVDRFGKIAYTAPYDAAFIGKDISGQKHIQEIMKTHRPVVSDVFTAVQGYRAIALHVPVFSGSEYCGTLGVLIDFQTIAKRFLQEVRVGETGYAWVTSKEGIELYCPVPGHTGKSVFENYKDFPTIITMAKEMVKGKQGVTTYMFDRVRDQRPETGKKHAVYLPIKIINSFWTIVVASSEDEVLASLVSFKNKLIIVVSLLLFGSAIFSYYGMRAWGIVREAAERQKAEEALRDSELRFRELFNHMSSGVAIYDSPDNGQCFVFKDLNRAGLEYGQKKKEAVVGLEVREVFPGVVALGLFDVFKRVWKTGNPEHYPSSMYKDNKLVLCVENYVCKLPSGELVAIYEDTTAQKKAEEAKEKLEKQLQQ
ncbi:MAG: Cache 3/Cache 2 fusion domain-containing protein [Proteobacteria bacterium]|nr:Cache 3/Cache 2 fusion domain-containing protein [Pseudomonadota bacterium]